MIVDCKVVNSVPEGQHLIQSPLQLNA